MTEKNKNIKEALQESVVLELRSKGFKGSFPHFRRPRKDGIDLISFQFDKWGGGFVIEISRCPSTGITTHWGKVIAASKMTAQYMNPKDRPRLGPNMNVETDHWFRYENGQMSASIQEVIALLPVAEVWWLGK